MPHRILVATRKGLFFLEKHGSQPDANGTGKWSIAQSAFLGDNVGIVQQDSRDGAIYAALDHGHFGCKLHRSTDAGKSWTEIGVPIYPPKPEGPPQLDGFGRPMEWKLNRIWALETGHVSQPGVLWCGTIPGGLFRSNDSGQTWELVRSLWDHPQRIEWFGGGADLPGIHSICVDPRDPLRMTVGVSCGGVWVTEDGAESWNCRAEGMWASYMPPERKFDPVIQDPHRVVQCAGNPDYLWAQHHNGIFRTTNGCANWQDVSKIEPSSFGFSVAVHPNDGNTAWFVPGLSDERRIPAHGKVVVARTRDGGTTYEILDKGLPSGHAYDITFRHALTISPDGNLLVFGSTTGSVWISEDQGDSWQTVSEHLPPVYSVHVAAC